MIKGVCQLIFMIVGRGMDGAKRRGQNGKCWFDAQGGNSSTRPVLHNRRSRPDRVIERRDLGRENGVGVCNYSMRLADGLEKQYEYLGIAKGLDGAWNAGLCDRMPVTEFACAASVLAIVELLVPRVQEAGEGSVGSKGSKAWRVD